MVPTGRKRAVRSSGGASAANAGTSPVENFGRCLRVVGDWFLGRGRELKRFARVPWLSRTRFIVRWPTKGTSPANETESSPTAGKPSLPHKAKPVCARNRARTRHRFARDRSDVSLSRTPPKTEKSLGVSHRRRLSGPLCAKVQCLRLGDAHIRRVSRFGDSADNA